MSARNRGGRWPNGRFRNELMRPLMAAYAPEKTAAMMADEVGCDAATVRRTLNLKGLPYTTEAAWRRRRLAELEARVRELEVLLARRMAA